MSIIPMSSFDTVTQKSNQVLVSHMTNSFNFHTEFFLCLSSKWKNKNIEMPHKLDSFAEPNKGKWDKKLSN